RDDVEMWEFHCTVPDGAKEIVIEVDYICSQPETLSNGIDSLGNSLIGAINWNTCILYPREWKSADTSLAVSLHLPNGWKYATPLDVKEERDGIVTFKPLRLDEVIDSPLLCGEHVRTIPLEQPFRPAFLHLVSESPSATNLKPELIQKYANVVAEA